MTTPDTDWQGRVWVEWGALSERQRRRIGRRHPRLAVLLDEMVATERQSMADVLRRVVPRLPLTKGLIPGEGKAPKNPPVPSPRPWAAAGHRRYVGEAG